jgi:hypothetical protein
MTVDRCWLLFSKYTLNNTALLLLVAPLPPTAAVAAVAAANTSTAKLPLRHHP